MVSRQTNESKQCHLVTNEQISLNLKIENTNSQNGACEKPRGIMVDNKPNFDEHLDRIIKKTNHKVNPFIRTFTFMDLPKIRILTNSFFTSQFSYCTSFGSVMKEPLIAK